MKDLNDKIYKTGYDLKNIDKDGPVILLDDHIKVSRFSKVNINDYVINNKKIQNSNCKILTFEQGPTKNINFLEESINY